MLTEPSQEPRIVIIVLNWNGREITLQCLRSLERLKYGNYATILVDNGSRDGSVEAVSTDFPQVKVLSLPVNLGFAGGNNAGLEVALQQNPDWIMFLNNDTEVAPDLLTALTSGIKRFPDGAVFGPKIYYGEEEDLIWYAGGEMNLPLGRLRHRGIRERDQGQYNQAGPTDFVSGCCLLIRADLVRQLGGFDPSYVMYTEDADLCYRVRQLGFSCYYLPDGRIKHYLSSSIGGELSLRKVYLKWRSGMRFLRLYASPWHWPSIIVYQLLYYSVLGPARYIRRRRGK
ncbi:MAG: glycosyltransferase family 2 protein [Fidelibacterota bacterium]|nr:MAG: glycosyltransferase family 2 protein [Candidatus Neomarinimicrobiota bacterium]